MWLYLPGWPSSSRDTEDSDSASRSQPAPGLWCTSSGEHSPRASSWPGWRKRPWWRLLSGTTCPPSTADRFAASWIASLAEAPVRTSASQESAPASWVFEADFGERCSESYARQGLLSFSGKTSGEPSLPLWTWSRRTLRASDSELRRALWALRMLEPRTSGNDSSSWPTPRGTDGAKGGPNQTMKGKPSLTNLAAHWPTPTVDGNHNRKACSPTSGDGLATVAKNWATPMSSARERTPKEFKRGNPNLAAQAQKFWSTPVAHDSKDTGAPSEFSRNTPSLLPQAMQRAGEIGAALNPCFVEALMGLPSGWSLPRSASNSSETASFPSRPPPHSSSAGNDSSEDE